jgi:uncharacterized membrane protein YfcA
LNFRIALCPAPQFFRYKRGQYTNTPELNQTVRVSKPKLWNPNVAANWSLIFSPIFGALLLSKNWTELGQPDRAKSNQTWAIGCIIFLLFVVLVPSRPMLDRTMQLGGIILLLTWYFSQGRKQAKFVKEKYGKEYEKKKWGQPILIAIGCFVGFIIVATGIGFIYEILFGGID